AAAPVCSDQQSGGIGIAHPTNSLPPLTDTVRCKGSRVMVNPDTDPPKISRQVVDAVGYRAAQFLDQEVMDPDLFRVALRAILAAWVAEIPDQFLFLGVDRDHRLLFRQSRVPRCAGRSRAGSLRRSCYPSSAFERSHFIAKLQILCKVQL